MAAKLAGIRKKTAKDDAKLAQATVALEEIEQVRPWQKNTPTGGGGLFNRGVNYGRGRGLVRAGQQREEKTQRNDGFYFLGIGMDLNHIWFVDSRTAWQECGQDWVFVLRGFAVLAVNTVLLQSQCDWSVHFPTLYTASVRQKSSS